MGRQIFYTPTSVKRVRAHYKTCRNVYKFEIRLRAFWRIKLEKKNRNSRKCLYEYRFQNNTFKRHFVKVFSNFETYVLYNLIEFFVFFSTDFYTLKWSIVTTTIASISLRSIIIIISCLL